MKKLISLFLALMMVFSLATVAFAEDPLDPDRVWTENGAKITALTNTRTNNTPGVTNGSIKITGVQVDGTNPNDQLRNEYKIYKMLHLESYNTESKVYSYVIIDKWKNFFIPDPSDPDSGAGAAYIKINDNGYVEWNNSEDDSVVAEFAKLALTYAEKHSIPYVQSSINHVAGCPGGNCTCELHSTFLQRDNADSPYYGKFEGLSMGYYLVDSNVGALCGLTTTNPEGLIGAKNSAPNLEKQVQEDSAVESGTNSWFTSNSAEIGQYINFDITIDVHAGAQNYILHDTMSEGLTFYHGTLKETVDGVEKDVKHGILEVVRRTDTNPTGIKLVEGTDYTVVTNPTDGCGCTFHIIFSEDLCKLLASNDNIYVTYDAKLDEDALIYDIANKSTTVNTNEAYVSYGDGHTTTTTTKTETRTYSFDLVKTDGDGKLLKDAEFKLFSDAGCTKPVKLVLCSDGSYRVATMAITEKGEVEVDTIVVTKGYVTIKGLDVDTYYLKETKAPEGYNILSSAVAVPISNDSHLSATITKEGTEDIWSPGTGIQVKNSAGSTLPSTGGLGTLLFTLLGGGTALGTGVVLVTKKRMSMIEE